MSVSTIERLVPLLLVQLALSSALILATLVAMRASHRATPGLRHGILTAVAAWLIVSPLLALVVSGLPVAAEALTGRSARAIDAAARTLTVGLEGRVAAVVGVAWLAGAAVIAARPVFGTLVLRRLVRHAIEDVEALGMLEDAGRLWRSTRVRCVRIRGAWGPLCFGVLKPTIVLSAASRTWPPASLRAALLHEMAHVRRRDPAARLLMHAASALYWPTPIRLLARQQAREAELAADALAAGASPSPAAYASRLLDLAAVKGIAPAPGPALHGDDWADLDRRIRTLLGPATIDRGARRRTVLAVVLLSTIGVVVAASQVGVLTAGGARVGAGVSDQQSFGPDFFGSDFFPDDAPSSASSAERER